MEDPGHTFVHAQQLYGYLDGTIIMSSQFITQGTGDNQTKVLNPDYLRWYVQDHAVLCVLLSSITEDMLGQMTQYNTARQVWTTHLSMFSSKNHA
jgi:hypothetical protein